MSPHQSQGRPVTFTKLLHLGLLPDTQIGKYQVFTFLSKANKIEKTFITFSSKDRYMKLFRDFISNKKVFVNRDSKVVVPGWKWRER